MCDFLPECPGTRVVSSFGPYLKFLGLSLGSPDLGNSYGPGNSLVIFNLIGGI